MSDEAVVRIVVKEEKDSTSQPPLPDYAHTPTQNVPQPPPGFKTSMMDMTPSGARNKAAQELLNTGQASSFDDALSKAKLVSQYVEDYSLAFDNVKQRIVGSLRGQKLRDALAEVESAKADLQAAHDARMATPDYGTSGNATPVLPLPPPVSAPPPPPASDPHQERQLLNAERKRKRDAQLAEAEAKKAQAAAAVPAPPPPTVPTASVAPPPVPPTPPQPSARRSAAPSIAAMKGQNQPPVTAQPAAPPAPATPPVPRPTPTVAPTPPVVASPAPAALPVTPPAPGGGGGLQALAGMGGAGGNIAAMVAGALPPVAIALAVKEMANQVNAAITGGIKNAIGGAGAIASGIASANTDPAVPIAALGDASSKAGEKLNELVPGLGNALVVVGEVQKAFAQLMQAIDKTADRYAEFSPEIASAQAMAEVRQTMGDLRRSREVGPELARYIIAQSDMQQKFEDIKVKILTKMLPVVTKILTVLEAVVPSGEGIETAIGTVGLALTPIATALTAIFGAMKESSIELPKDPTDQLRFSNEFMNPGIGNQADPGLVPRR